MNLFIKSVKVSPAYNSENYRNSEYIFKMGPLNYLYTKLCCEQSSRLINSDRYNQVISDHNL